MSVINKPECVDQDPTPSCADEVAVPYVHKELHRRGDVYIYNLACVLDSLKFGCGRTDASCRDGATKKRRPE